MFAIPTQVASDMPEDEVQVRPVVRECHHHQVLHRPRLRLLRPAIVPDLDAPAPTQRMAFK